jgi:5-formyltetrahydrofolate cyclo-ligase
MERSELMAWRRATRATLIERRMAARPAERRAWSAAIEPRLEAVIGETRARLVGFYWPFRAEFDPRPLVDRLLAKGLRVALPVVVEPKTPMVFRPWTPGCAMTTGVWDIPIPDTKETVLPDLVMAPLVGFDGARYRLGYGGGYFDRTLAALSRKPFAVGVGFELGRLETVFPQPHDIAMDAIVTEAQAFSSSTVPAR